MKKKVIKRKANRNRKPADEVVVSYFIGALIVQNKRTGKYNIVEEDDSRMFDKDIGDKELVQYMSNTLGHIVEENYSLSNKLYIIEEVLGE